MMISKSPSPSDLDLATCDSEPIHVPGSIQPHGALLALSVEDLRVTQVSENLAAILGRPLDSILAATLGDVLGTEVGSNLAGILATLVDDETPRYLGAFPIGSRDPHSLYTLVAHRYLDTVILELEAVRPGQLVSFENAYPLTSAFIAKARETIGLDKLNRLVASEIRKLTGFDRVLIYRFDEDSNGTVIAEDRNDALPSLINHRFPGSDIPRQARDLYRINRLRLIPDAGYRPVPLAPTLRPDTGQPLDLTHAALRSVSPIHVEYMKNMGTAASMSISIIRDGELWGLISCHHSQPRIVPVLVRATCDFIGQVLSLQLAAEEHRTEYERRIGLKHVQSELLQIMAGHDDYRVALAQHPAKLLAFAGASGAAIATAESCTLFGETPSSANVLKIVEWLTQSVQKEVYHTSALAQEFPEARAYAREASGLMSISISKLHPSFVLWFRPEAAQTITWAGDPRKPTAPEVVAGRLHPRKSFEMWKETVEGRATPFTRSEVDAVADLRNSIVGIVLRQAEETAELSGALERSNKELEAFSYSVSHDLRAPFRHIVGYAELLRESLENRISPDERRYVESISDSAIQAGKLVDNLLSYSRMGRQTLDLNMVDLEALVREVQRSMKDEVADRDITWRISPLPRVHCDVMMMRLAIQNLLANAVKFTRMRATAVIEVGVDETEEEYLFHVRDNGIGFDMKYADKLFGVFQRMHRMEDFEGTGIGLANVRRIIARHGGRTWADAAVGRGATFFFTLPKTP